MELSKQIAKDMVAVMKSGDKLALSVLRMLKSDFKYKEIELKRELTDDDCLAVVTAAAKKRRDAIEGFEKGGRGDLVAKEKAELEIISKYLPAQIADEELTRIITEAIAETEATTPADIGLVMKSVMPRVKGRADGRKVNELVLKILQG